ncbi:MAG: hypothetical protein GY867_11215 [bacterium]|nr:hypothetical protein [bacterium]
MNSSLYFALIGKDIEYSLSPDIFEAIYGHLGRSGRFEVHSMGVKDLSSRLKQSVLDGVKGFSVTIPFKQEIIPYLDDIDSTAQAVSAVNSVAVEDGRLLGYNTDCHGFSHPLLPYKSLLCSGRALILGNGGVARAAIYSLHRDFGVRDFVVAGRHAANVDLLRDSFKGKAATEDINISPVRLSGVWSGQFQITVNCTPLGGWNNADSFPLPSAYDFSCTGIYYDLNYNKNNRAVVSARSADIIAIDGSSMLVSQAIESYRIWTGQSVPFEPIFEAVFGAVKGHSPSC